jgi:hypothetical protein
MNIAQTMNFGITAKALSIIFNHPIVCAKPQAAIVIFGYSVNTNTIVLINTFIASKKLATAKIG